MPPSEDEEADAVVRFFLADQQAQSLEDYISRGRYLECLSLTELQAVFVARLGNYANAVNDARSRRELDDVIAEFEILNIDLPFELAEREFEKVLQLSRQKSASMSGEEMAERGETLYKRYEASKKRRS